MSKTSYYIETEDGTIISGPYETKGDAFTARSAIERLVAERPWRIEVPTPPETFWIRDAEESESNRRRQYEAS